MGCGGGNENGHQNLVTKDGKMNLGTKLNNYLNIRYAKQNDWL